MKRTLFLLALTLFGAVPVVAQDSNEFGFLVGGSRRFVNGGGSVRSITGDAESDWIESNFSFRNSSIELYWSIPLESDVNLKIKGGRMENDVTIAYLADDPDTPAEDSVRFRRDVADGEIQHIEAVVEYEFDEPFGSTGLFAGAGLYRLSAEDEESQSTWGVTAGVNADFPITSRYGAILEGSYHWTRTEFNPRYLTVAACLRVSF